MTDKSKMLLRIVAVTAVIVVVVSLLHSEMPDWLRKLFRATIEGFLKWILGAKHVDHITDFVSAGSPLDLLIGRSRLQGLIVLLGMVAGTLIGGRKRWDGSQSFVGLIFGHFCGVMLGLTFELFRTSDFPSLQRYSAAPLGIVIAAVVLSLALNGPFLKRLGITLRGRYPRLVGQSRRSAAYLWHFIRQRRLHPELLGEGEATPAPEGGPAPGGESVPMTGATVAPEQETPLEGTEEAEAAPKLQLVDFEPQAMVKCPACRQLTPASGQFCAHCQPPVKLPLAGEPTSPVPPEQPVVPPALQANLHKADQVKCPKCQQWTPASGQFCAHCQPPVKLRPEEAIKPAATREGDLPRSLFDFLQETTP